jgi:hypothetical protein
MSTLIIDTAVVATAAQQMNVTPEQLITWFNANYETVKAVRLYIQTRGVTEPEFIENYAVEGQILDATLVENILILLQTGNLIMRLET